SVCSLAERACADLSSPARRAGPLPWSRAARGTSPHRRTHLADFVRNLLDRTDGGVTVGPRWHPIRRGRALRAEGDSAGCSLNPQPQEAFHGPALQGGPSVVRGARSSHAGSAVGVSSRAAAPGRADPTQFHHGAAVPGGA